MSAVPELRRGTVRTLEAFAIHEDDEAGAAAAAEDDEADGEDDAVSEAQDDEPESESSDDEPVDANVQRDMEHLEDTFPPGFRSMFRLIKRIGEGTFSTVYKAEDLKYHMYDNGSWDMDEKENSKWSTPPLKRFRSLNEEAEAEADAGSEGGDGSTPPSVLRQQLQGRRRAPRYVAIKKIYVTSSPARILNELELLHDLRACDAVCPLITAFRHADQVVAVLPYFRHADFRDYFRHMTTADVAVYLRSLFVALRAVHAKNILHRDIKPTNFLYDPRTRRGVLVDFGLAEREGQDSKPCICHDDPAVRRARVRGSVSAAAGPQGGYPRQDTRPSRRANRAGTRGFRAPEVLFKCTEQTTKIDVWSAGVVLLTILSRRFPFFNSTDDVEAMVEIATIFGSKRMKAAGLLHGSVFETNIPTISLQGFALERIILWSTCRMEGSSSAAAGAAKDDSAKSKAGSPLTPHEKLAVEFLGRCLELDPTRRISAEEALEHEFLRLPETEMENTAEDDEMDMLAA